MAMATFIDNAKRQMAKSSRRRTSAAELLRRRLGHALLTAVLLFFATTTFSSRVMLIGWFVTLEVWLYFVPDLNLWIHAHAKSIHTSMALLQILAVIAMDRFNKPEVYRIPGVPPPPAGFPSGTSGDPRILVGPNGAVEMPFSMDVGSMISVASNYAVYGGKPYVTGDDVSVIIVARDEDEFLSKTIKYTYETSPLSVLREIIVVDDASANLQSEILNRELPQHIKRIVRTMRFNTKEGLIRARIAGADAAEASNIFFMDGHCRPKPGWLPPLMKHLKANYRRLACPIIHDIKRDTWADAGTSGSKMMFEWNFEFGWYDDLTDEVPLSAGGIFAMTKRWWQESGKYDPGMLEWGGENLEQSFRVWMCGGDIYVVRDSNVGHIFNRPPKPNPEGSLVRQVQTNQKRGALVWLDDYYQFFERFHSVVKTLTEGPLDDRHALRRRLRCKSFQWYVDKFRTSFERKGLLVDHYHHLRHVRSRWCLTAMPANSKGGLVLEPCVFGDKRQKWSNVAGNRMLHVQEGLRCLDRNQSALVGGKQTAAADCQWNEVFKAEYPRQFWQFDPISTHHIFSWNTKDFKTLTGNDFFPVNQSKGVEASSVCLAAPLGFWNGQMDAKNMRYFEKNKVYPSDVVVQPCYAARGDGWTDEQAWEWLW